MIFDPDKIPRFEWHKGETLDYREIFAWRQRVAQELACNNEALTAALNYYSTHHVEFITHWVTTYDPRLAMEEGKTSYLPFILFKRQFEFLDFLHTCVQEQQHGLCEKSRDMGLTWICCAYSVFLWRFVRGAAIGWGSREQDLVDKIGDADSIFEKMRILIRALPPFFYPHGFSQNKHMAFMRIINPQTGASITGDIGDNIGRGGRKLVYFKDESAHYEHADSIEAALGDTARCQIDISSVKGLGTVFHRKRINGVDWAPGQPLTRGYTNVFVMDWRDHPDKSKAWYEERRAKAAREGLLAKFAQEVDRDYAASLEGVIIKAEWVHAAMDAHLRLNFGPQGGFMAGLDVADEGGDTNALCTRQGPCVLEIDEWGERDTGYTARRAFGKIAALPVPKGQRVILEYDAVGVGATIKAEANRLREERLFPRHLMLVPWHAGASPQQPDLPIMVDEQHRPDQLTPINKNFFANLKAQAWWNVGRRFERTYRAINAIEARAAGDKAHPDHDFTWDVDELISIPSTMPLKAKLQMELSQAVIKYNPSLKIAVDKKPDGAKSPNLADALIMAFYPADANAAPDISIEMMEWSMRRQPTARELDRRPFVTDTAGEHLQTRAAQLNARLSWSQKRAKRTWRL